MEFDQSKSYQWDENAEITISGKDYGLLNHFIRTQLSSPEAQLTLLALEAQKVVAQILKKEVESGNFTEVKQEENV